MEDRTANYISKISFVGEHRTVKSMKTEFVHLCIPQSQLCILELPRNERIELELPMLLHRWRVRIKGVSVATKLLPALSSIIHKICQRDILC